MVLTNTNNFKTNLFVPYMGPYQALPLPVKVDLRVMAMKKNFILLRSPEQKLHHKILFVIRYSSFLRVGENVFLLNRGLSMYSKSRRHATNLLEEICIDASTNTNIYIYIYIYIYILVIYRQFCWITTF